MKIRHKITLLFASIVTAMLLLLSFAVYWITSFERESSFRVRLLSRAAYNAQIFSSFSEDFSLLNLVNENSSFLLPRKSVGIYDTSGVEIYRYDSYPLDSDKPSLADIREAIAARDHFFTMGSREALIYYPGQLDGKVILIAAYDEDGFTKLKRLRQLFLVCLMIGIILSLVAGYLFSHQLLKPVRRIIAEANEISSKNLSKRIEPGHNQDELGKLAETLNDLLNRLQESFITQNRFISNASHELSTPLTSISSQLQVALQRERSVDEYERVCQSVLEDVQQLLQLTKSLLEIAKTGSDGNIEIQEIRIDELIFWVVGDVQKISATYKVDIHFDDPGEEENAFLVYGNIDLLYISLKNIIENGCKFSDDHRSQVTLSPLPGWIRIQVANSGGHIPEQEKSHIYQPFFRSSASLSIPGFGLGLALARRIIAIHKGEIYFSSSADQGTVFTISLPVYESLASEKLSTKI